jgi:hypothetical protein
MPITTDSAAVAARTPAVQSAALGGASAGIAGNIPVAQSVAIQLNRPIDQSTTLAGGPRISVTVLPLDEDASESDPAGQATIIGGTIGTPFRRRRCRSSWRLAKKNDRTVVFRL